MALVKIISRKTSSYKQLVNYINKGSTEIPAMCFGFPYTTNAKTVASHFKKHEEYASKRLENKLYHVVVSFHQKDKVDRKIMEDMLDKYLLETKLNSSTYLSYAGFHTDHDNKHIHLMHSTHDTASKSFRLSKSELKRIQRELDKYGLEKWNLRHSVVYDETLKKQRNHGFTTSRAKQQFTDAEIHMKKRGKVAIKAHIIQRMSKLATAVTSEKDFEKKLHNDTDLSAYYYRGKLTGIVYQNKKYRLQRLLATKDVKQVFRKLQYLARTQDTTRTKTQDRTL